MLRSSCFAVAGVVCLSASAHAGAFTLPTQPADTPALSMPNAAGPTSRLSLLDSSRFHFSNMLVMSSGFGSGSSGDFRSMAYSTLSYDMGGPLSASVTVGNRLMGTPRYPGDTGKMSLESLRLNYQPTKNLTIRMDMVGSNYLRDTAVWGEQRDWTRR